MESPGRQRDSDVGSPVSGYAQASSEGDSMRSVQDSSSQEGRRETELQGQRGQGKGTDFY